MRMGLYDHVQDLAVVDRQDMEGMLIGLCRLMGICIHTGMCVDICIDMRKHKCTDMCVDICIDMHKHKCTDMCAYTCTRFFGRRIHCGEAGSEPRQAARREGRCFANGRCRPLPSGCRPDSDGSETERHAEARHSDHNYIGRNRIGHNCAGHNYSGHNYIGLLSTIALS